jgi:hypothetical protein
MRQARPADATGQQRHGRPFHPGYTPRARFDMSMQDDPDVLSTE